MSPPGPAASPFRVLIVRTGAMGDVLHAMPAVAAMRARHPEWVIGWAIEPRWLPLLQSGNEMPLVDRVHEVPTRAWNQHPFSPATLRSVLHVRRELRSARYDLCVDMQGLLRSAIVGRFARARVFAGNAHPRESLASRLYSRGIETTAAHVVDRGCELLGAAIEEPLAAAPVPLPRDAAAEVWCDDLLAASGSGKPIAILAPTAGWGAKQWPVERYGLLAVRLAAAGFLPLINAAKEHDSVAAAVTRASGGSAVPVVCGMVQLVALLRRAAIVIAGDTGPLHLAAALGRPVVGLYGPTHPARTGPYGIRSRVIRHQTSTVDHRRHPEPETGLAQITVDEAAEAAFQMLDPEQPSLE